MINKILKDLKQTELTADNMIKEAEKNADKIITKAISEVEELKKSTKSTATVEGKKMIINEEESAKKEAEAIKNKCKTEEEKLKKDSLDKIEKAVNFVADKIIEGL